MILRTLTIADIPQLKKIWKDTFHDTDAFLDWYFDTRFFPDYSACAEDNGKIVSVCHILPARQYLRGKVLPCGLLNGVATLPEYRGKGLMKQLIRFLYPLLSGQGIYLMPNTPAAFAIYEPCGHYPASSAVSVDTAESRVMPDDILSGRPDASSLDKLFSIYCENAARYSAMLCRTKEEFLRKMSEYAIDGAEVFLHEKGYAILAETENAFLCPEIIAANTEAYRKLIDALFSRAFPKKLQGKFPSDAFPDIPSQPRSVLGITNLGALIKEMQFDLPVTLEITDPFYPKNSGLYSLNSDPPAENADISLSVGSFAEWVSGYKNIEETDAVLHTDCTARFPKKQLCFTNDDY